MRMVSKKKAAKKTAKRASKKSAKKVVKKAAKKTAKRVPKKAAKKAVKKSAKKVAKTATKKTARRTATARKTRVEEPLVLQPLRGMRDILPGDQPYWEQVRRVLNKAAQEYGFNRIQTPLVEFENLFVRSVGSTTEVVQKEMYSFVTRGGDRVALRPELTAGNVRAFIQHGMNVWPKPVKLFSMGPVYRYDRPQEGRYREHVQGNFDIYGESDPIIDAQMVQMAHRILHSLGIKDVVFHINSIGTPKTRAAYKKKLTKYLEKYRRKIPAELRAFITDNPFRILDAKDPVCAEIAAGAPRAVDALDPESKEHFARFVEYLDELGITYVKDDTLVRGLDYYTQTVFEVFVRGEGGKRRSLGGGGRYDALIKALGGEDMPAMGFGLGLDRIVLEMKRVHAKSYELPRPRVFLAQLGDLAKKKSLTIFAMLQKAGILTSESFGRGNLRAQLRKAERSGVDVAIIIGQKEALDGTVILKDMMSGSQETVDVDKMVPTVKKLLKNISK